MVLFSVIIPHYNSVKYLEKLVKSIPAEEMVQVIVVDDKSTQDTKEAEKLVLSRGGLFIHNTTDKKGAGVCRNLGLKEAKGKWLLFADADDYYVEGAFDTVKDYAGSEADIVYFSPVSVYIDTEKQAERHVPYEILIRNYQKEPSVLNEISMRYKFIIPVSKMVRNELVQKNNILFDEIPASNDVMFSLKCAEKASKLEVTDKVIYCITKAEGTLTTKRDEINFWARVQVFKERCLFLRERLNEAELCAFGFSTFSGLVMIIRALKQGYGLKMAKEIYCFYRKNNVKIIDRKSLFISLRNQFVGRK